MLVLSRKQDQQIKIGDQVTVTILRVKGNTVRIGIQAPRDVRVVRGELPKMGAGEEPANEAAGIPVLTIVADVEAGPIESAEETADHAQDACQREFLNAPAPISAAHLPLRRMRQRFGRGPLKQLVAACPALAK